IPHQLAVKVDFQDFNTPTLCPNHILGYGKFTAFVPSRSCVLLSRLNGWNCGPATCELKFLEGISRKEFFTQTTLTTSFHCEDGGNTKTEIGRSETISNDLNPDWKFEFELTFDRNNNQYLYFHVYDHDIMKIDDTLGRLLDNYNDKGSQAGSGKLPIPPDAAVAENGTLQFKLSASGLPTKDDILFIKRTGDPYGRTKTVPDSQHPVWNDVITFNWNRNLDQRIRFTIFDEDLIKHDRFDHVWMEVNDYVAKGQNYTLLLPKKGSITITKAH
ncbi:Cytosolic phospholipase A2 beta, partial [Orchesella cincta]